MPLSANVSLGSRYTLRSMIAVGGMGEVWRAEDTLLHRTVAVKVLKTNLGGDPTFLTRFRAEARHSAGLAHPGIARVFDYGETNEPGTGPGDTAYLVMELIDGEPLSALLARTGRLPADQVLDVIAQTAQALEAAHAAGVIHRDVKPGNILIQPDGTVKITDFGIARAVDAAPVTATGMVMGTSYYLSPEQASGQRVTPASDVYSLGVVGYEALASVRPFVGDSALAVAMMHIRQQPPPLPSDVPGAARAVIERAMAKDPAARFPTAVAMSEAATAARTATATQPLRAAPTAPTPRDHLAETRVLSTTTRMPAVDAGLRAAPVRHAPAAQYQPPATSRPSAAVLLVVGLLIFTLCAVVAHVVTREMRNRSAGSTVSMSLELLPDSHVNSKKDG